MKTLQERFSEEEGCNPAQFSELVVRGAFIATLDCFCHFGADTVRELEASSAESKAAFTAAVDQIARHLGSPGK